MQLVFIMYGNPPDFHSCRFGVLFLYYYSFKIKKSLGCICFLTYVRKLRLFLYWQSKLFSGIIQSAQIVNIAVAQRFQFFNCDPGTPAAAAINIYRSVFCRDTVRKSAFQFSKRNEHCPRNISLLMFFRSANIKQNRVLRQDKFSITRQAPAYCQHNYSAKHHQQFSHSTPLYFCQNSIPVNNPPYFNVI